MNQEYVILSQYTPDQLIEVVNEALKEGWQCQGGIAVGVFEEIVELRRETVTMYYQAMVKDIEQDKPKTGIGFSAK